jgi:hypothetical protein
MKGANQMSNQKPNFHFADQDLADEAAHAYEEKRKRLGQRRDPVEDGDPQDPQDAEAAWQARKLAHQEFWKNKR